jgi:hypothetical protein
MRLLCRALDLRDQSQLVEMAKPSFARAALLMKYRTELAADPVHSGASVATFTVPRNIRSGLFDDSTTPDHESPQKIG